MALSCENMFEREARSVNKQSVGDDMKRPEAMARSLSSPSSDRTSTLVMLFGTYLFAFVISRCPIGQSGITLAGVDTRHFADSKRSL
jgi:hypothetical protein